MDQFSDNTVSDTSAHDAAAVTERGAVAVEGATGDRECRTPFETTKYDVSDIIEHNLAAETDNGGTAVDGRTPLDVMVSDTSAHDAAAETESESTTVEDATADRECRTPLDVPEMVSDTSAHDAAAETESGSAAVEDATVDREYRTGLEAMMNAADSLVLESPDVDTLRQDRQDRTRAAMQALDPALTRRVLPKSHNLSSEEKAAICLQCHFRGYLGRKRYVQLLFEHFTKEEEMRRLRTLKQCEEGELLIENHKLEIEFEDNHCVRRNRSQRFLSNIITIQRAWRKYKKSQTNHWYPETNALHFNDRHDNEGGGDEPTDNNGNANESTTRDSLDVTKRSCTLEPTEQRNFNVNQQQASDLNSDVELHLWKLDNTNDNMASPLKSNKKHVPIFQDLGSSVELDDKEVFDDVSPDITPAPVDKNVNRLSLAEEFAAMSEGVMGESLDGEDETESELDSEFDIASSSATTPDWDLAPPKNDDKHPPRVVSQEEQEINENTNSLMRGVKPGAMQDADRNRLSISDANENYNDPNANSVSMDSDLDLEPAILQQQQHNSDNDTLTDNECESVNARNNHKEDLIRVSSFEPSEQLRHVQVESPHRTAETAVDSPNEDEEKTLSFTEELPTEAFRKSTPSHLLRHGSVDTGTNSNVLSKKTNASAELAGLEDTMPVLDWESLEKHLAKMEKEEEEQQSLKESQRNSRQAILRKLAMGTDDEAEGDIYGKGKDTLSRRLQSGMNLQICFVNEPVEGSGSDFEDDGHQTSKEYHGSPYHHSYSGFSSAAVRSKSTGALSRECSNNSTSSGGSQRTPPSVTFEDEEDFDVKQARLQEEARIALARAEPLARMQMELERQQRKKSPVTELAGVTGLRDITISLGCRKFTRRALRNMSISKLQFIVNDLHSQIERLNDQLVEALIERDDLQTELELKQLKQISPSSHHHFNCGSDSGRKKDMQQNNNNSLIGKQPLENGHRRQYETLVKLLSSTLPVRNKCLCGVSRSSSVVSNRSACSPVSPVSPQSYQSQSSMSTTMSESHMSSPEMTWVRQAMVKYWYN